MMPLAQLNGLTEAQRAVRDHFQEGGSFSGVLAALVVVALIVLVAWWLTRRSERRREATRQPDPAALFDEVIERLGLDSVKARVLHDMALHADVNHPTVLLLSRDVFDRTATSTQSHSGKANPVRTATIEALRRDLFDPPSSDDPPDAGKPPTD